LKLPVQLGRAPDEPVDTTLQEFYERLLRAAAGADFRESAWDLCPVQGWPDNDTGRDILAWSWSGPEGKHVVAINWSDRPAQGRVRIPGHGPDLHSIRFSDLLSGDVYERSSGELRRDGLYVGLPSWGFHFLEF